MGPYTLNIVACASVLIPFLTGAFVYNRAEKEYYPFFYFLALITVINITGAIALICFPIGFQVMIGIWNICTLYEAWVMTWLYYKRGFLHNKTNADRLILIMYLIIWIVELKFRGVKYEFVYFEIILRFVASIQSVRLINELIKRKKKKLLVNSKFIFYIGFFTYYFIDLTASIFALSFFHPSKSFRWRLYSVSNVCTILTFFIFTYALILMGRKSKRYISQGSYDLFANEYLFSYNGEGSQSP